MAKALPLYHIDEAWGEDYSGSQLTKLRVVHEKQGLVYRALGSPSSTLEGNHCVKRDPHGVMDELIV